MNALTEWKITTKATLVAALVASAVAAGIVTHDGGTGHLAAPASVTTDTTDTTDTTVPNLACVAPAPYHCDPAPDDTTTTTPDQTATVVERVQVVEGRVDGIDTRLHAVEATTTTTGPKTTTALPSGGSTIQAGPTTGPQLAVTDPDPTPGTTVTTTPPAPTTTTTIPAFACQASESGLTVAVGTNKPGVPITLAWHSYYDLGDGYAPQDGTTTADTAPDGSYHVRIPERYRSAPTTSGPLGEVTISSISGGTCTTSW